MGEKLKKRIGEILIENGDLTKESLDEALLHQKKEGGMIGQILIRLGYITEENLVAALSKQLDFPYLPLQNYSVNLDVVRSMGHDFCKQNMTIAFDQDDKYIFVATADPLNHTAIEHLVKHNRHPAQVFISTPTEITNVLDLAFARDAASQK